jgi:hypothetical protein
MNVQFRQDLRELSEGSEAQRIPAMTEDEAPFSPIFNVFRHRLARDLFCAVPEDRPVPTFIEARNWTFAGTTAPYPRGGFDPDAGRTAARCNGFYLFVASTKRAGIRPLQTPPLRGARYGSARPQNP